METLSLIDVASEDDLLLVSAPPPQLLDPSSPGCTAAKISHSETTDVQEGEIVNSSVPNPSDQVPEHSASPKQNAPKSVKSSYDLRKSINWDSAFFTSEGLLNNEELAAVNSAFRNNEASSKLPEIPEETRRSRESTTTLDSESWEVENFGMELFDDVRASIQRSLGKSDKVRSADKSVKTPGSSINPSRLGLTQKVEPTSRNKIKLHPSTSQRAISKQRPDVTPKEPRVPRVASPGPAELKAPTRPLKILPKPALPRVANKTAIATGSADNRSNTGGALNRKPIGKSANSSATVSSQSVRAPKSGLGTTTPGTFSLAASSTSRGTSLSTSTRPHSGTKSPTLSNNKRSAQRIPLRSSSGAAINKDSIPLRTSRSKIPTRTQGDRTSRTDPTIKCPSISLSSSGDSLVSVTSEVSSLASTGGKSSNTTERSDVRSFSSPRLVECNSRPPLVNLSPPVVVHCNASGGASGNYSVNSINTSTQGEGSKPSGLRMPTPRIGYFDAVKSLRKNVDTVTHSGQQSTKLQYSGPAIQRPQDPST